MSEYELIFWIVIAVMAFLAFGLWLHETLKSKPKQVSCDTQLGDVMNIQMIEPPTCTLSEIFQPMVPWIAFASGVAIGGAMVLLYLKMVVL
jgi:hypothetical protein